MTHTSSPKRVVFEPNTVEIFDISTGKLISQGVTNHISKEYEFLCFFPYSDSFQDMQLVKREGKSILPKLFFTIIQAHNLKMRIKLNQISILRMHLKQVWIEIQSLLPILALNGLIKSLRLLETWVEIHLAKGEPNINFKMRTLHNVLQIHFSQRCVIKF